MSVTKQDITPRHVPLPVQAKIREELIRMESLGVISPVTSPQPGVLAWLSCQSKMASEFVFT